MSDLGRTCSSCRYYDRARSLCRFSAPSSIGWPTAKADDWCGEWGAPRTAKQTGEADTIKPQLAEERRGRSYRPAEAPTLRGLR